MSIFSYGRFWQKWQKFLAGLAGFIFLPARISAKKFLHTDNSAHIFCDAYTTSIVFWKETVYHYSTVSFKETMDTVHTHFVHTAFRDHEKFYTTASRYQLCYRLAVVPCSRLAFPENFCDSHC